MARGELFALRARNTSMSLSLPCDPAGQSRAFTIVELLAVVAIIALLTSLSVVGIASVLTGSRLSATGMEVTDALSEARQLALARGKEVQVRFYKKEPEGFFDQLSVVVSASGSSPAEYSRVGQPFPTGIVGENDAALSTLASLVEATENGPNAPSSVRNRKYVAVKFLADGRTDLATDSEWSIVLRPRFAAASGKTPGYDNYIAVVVDPLSGRTFRYQP